MIFYSNKGTIPTFEFYCRVCGEEFTCCGDGEKIEQHPLSIYDGYFTFSATINCPCCGANIRSKKIQIPINHEKEEEYK